MVGARKSGLKKCEDKVQKNVEQGCTRFQRQTTTSGA